MLINLYFPSLIHVLFGVTKKKKHLTSHVKFSHITIHLQITLLDPEGLTGDYAEVKVQTVRSP